MPLTDYNKNKAYKETYDLLLLTYRKVKNVAPDVMVKSRFDVLHRTKSIDDELYEDVMKRADCIKDELDTLMETKKEILGTD